MNIDISLIIVCIFLTLNIFSFILGYFLGKLSKINLYNKFDEQTANNDDDTKTSQKMVNSKISIDETKIVSKIDTNSLEKKYDTFTNTVIANDSISSSIDKLKKMKE